MAENAKMHEVMEGFQKNLASQLQRIEPEANMRLNNTLQQCFQRSNDNADRFAECVVGSNKKLNDVMEGFQFKMLFLSRSAKACLEKGDSVPSCVQRVTTQGKSIIDGVLKQVEKI